MTVISKPGFVIVPDGLVSLITVFVISFDLWTRHAILEYSLVTLMMTPSTPSADALMLPISEDSCITSSLRWVGHVPVETRMCIQLCNAQCIIPCFLSATRVGWMCIVRLNGTHKSLLVGIPKVVCRSLPTKFSNRL